jgi:hypothetical protein
MEVHLRPEKETQLAEIAVQRGLDPDDLVQACSKPLPGGRHEFCGRGQSWIGSGGARRVRRAGRGRQETETDLAAPMRLRWTDPAANDLYDNDLYDNDLYDIVQHIQQDNPDKATDSLRRLRKPDQISVSRPQGTNRRN